MAKPSAKPPTKKKPSPPDLADYFYVLSQSWSPALKYHLKWGQKNPRKFCYWTLHSLWLNAIGKRMTNYEFDPPFTDFRSNLNRDTECLEKLNAVCPSLLPGQSNEEHQDRKVLKHGTCVMHYAAQDNIWDLSNGKGYLCTAATLAKEFNMSRYLQNTQLGEKYEIGHLINVIQAGTNVRPCIKYFSANGENYLSEIYLCFDKHLNLINTQIPNSNLNTKVTYLGCDNNTRALQVPENTSDGAQPHGAQPHGAQPHGAQPHGALPHGAQPHGAQPHGAQGSASAH